MTELPPTIMQQPQEMKAPTLVNITATVPRMSMHDFFFGNFPDTPVDDEETDCAPIVAPINHSGNLAEESTSLPSSNKTSYNSNQQNRSVSNFVAGPIPDNPSERVNIEDHTTVSSLTTHMTSSPTVGPTAEPHLIQRPHQACQDLFQPWNVRTPLKVQNSKK